MKLLLLISREVMEQHADVREMIIAARAAVSRNVNAALTLLHCQVGNRIRTDILRKKRAVDYGKQIVTTLSRQLTA